MAHIRIQAAGPGATCENGQIFMMTVDGVDISRSVLGDGFAIEWPTDLVTENPVVALRLDADVLDLDLPTSLLDAVVTKAGA